MQGYRQDHIWNKTVEQDGILEAPRLVPVRERVDVLVCGGGPAGVGAALAAAHEGANVLLIERFGMLGGMWTAGLVNPLFKWEDKGFVVEALCTRLESAGAWRAWGSNYAFEPEIMRLVLEEMMREAGARFLYYTHVADSIVTDGRIRGVVIESKAGREAILADVVIDATGDGDVAARSGCRYEMGRSEDGRTQPVTLMFEITGADHFQQTDAMILYDLLAPLLDEEGKRAVLPFGRVSGAPWIITLPSARSAVQTTHVYCVNPLDPADLTRGVAESRIMMHRFLDTLRKVKGFENVCLTQSASALGIREGRRILGRNTVTYEHARAGQHFDDAVTVSCFHIDIHDPNPNSGISNGRGPSKPFEIPYGCLVPQDVEGLLLAGRCISGDHRAHASYRVTGTAMAIGQAAGLAAAMAVKRKTIPSLIDGESLHAELAGRGAVFLPR